MFGAAENETQKPESKAACGRPAGSHVASPFSFAWRSTAAEDTKKSKSRCIYASIEPSVDFSLYERNVRADRVINGLFDIGGGHNRKEIE